MPDFKTGNRFVAVFTEGLLNCEIILFDVRRCLAKKLVGETDDLFF